MHILADENIPCADEAFGPLGQLTKVAGRSVTRKLVAECDVLLVRSVTPVTRGLIEGSPVRFVGTVTAGFDHIDKAALAEAGIGFASAAGSNAESVAEYIASVLVTISERQRRPLAGKSIGIIGVGHCGSRVERVVRALGMVPVLCDPPLKRATGDKRYRPLPELVDCDFITLHVPRIEEGRDRTTDLIEARFLAALRPTSVVINASRGGVVNEIALIDALQGRRIDGAAIDVWKNEPWCNPDLIREVDIATPHIAGYSLDGKIRGTEMIHEALCKHLCVQPFFKLGTVLESPERSLELDPGEGSGDWQTLATRLIREVYDVRTDSAAMVPASGMSGPDRALHFDRLRKEYARRREFAALRVVPNPVSEQFSEGIAALGFSS